MSIWPPLVLLLLQAMSLGMALMQHGSERRGHHNAWHDIIAVLGLSWILWWGGFFEPLFQVAGQ